MCNTGTVKPVLSGHSKIDKTKILKTNGSLMQVENIAECSPWSIQQCFWPALSNNRSWKPIFGLLFERSLKTGFTEENRGINSPFSRSTFQLQRCDLEWSAAGFHSEKLNQNCFVCLYWFFMSQSTIFQSCWDGSSLVEPVLSRG